MSWFPLGPDFVFWPDDPGFLRLSRRNEHGAQGTVTHIAVDPFDDTVIFAVDRPSSGGSGLHRSTDGGATWTSLLEPLHQNGGAQYGPDADPTCVTFHPHVPGHLYMGTGSKQNLYVSTDGGSTWSYRSSVGGSIRSVVADARSGLDAAHVGSTELYAATDTGLYHSGDDGTSWDPVVLPGSIWSVAARFPTTGSADFYATVISSGLWHSATPGDPSSWTNLSTGSTILAPGTSGSLPAHSASFPFDALLVDYCPAAPERVYVWVKGNYATLGLYRSTHGAAGPWTCLGNGATLPGPWQYSTNYVFRVAPSSAASGSGSTDVLFFGALVVYRSRDGGASWETLGDFHADLHSFAFSTDTPPPGAFPSLYIGCDGGIARSSGYTDPATPATGSNLNEGVALDLASPAFQNLNRGKQGSALYQMATDRRISALNYIGCVDTGLARGGGTLGWDAIPTADAGSVAIAPGPSGVNVWAIGGLYSFWPNFAVSHLVDNGTSTTGGLASLGPGGPPVGSSSNYVLGAGDACVAGLLSRTEIRTLTSNIPGGGESEFTLDSLAGIQAGTMITIKPDVEEQETRMVEAVVDPSTNRVRAYVGGSYPAGTQVKIINSYVGTIDTAGIASQLSQDLSLHGHSVHAVAANPDYTDVALCATRRDWTIWGELDPNYIPRVQNEQRVWWTSGGTAAMSTWTQVTAGAPATFRVASTLVDRSGQAYVLLHEPTGTSPATPLFRVSDAGWQPITCVSAPSGFLFGKMVEHPTEDGTFFAANGGRVYRLSLAGDTCTWTDISDGAAGLPGTWVYDLWSGNIDPRPGRVRALLRAAVATRGIWEKDVTPGAGEAELALYVRDNVVDQGWLDESPSGVPDPLQPATPAWFWQSADIKLDVRHTAPDFFQTDPEWDPASTPHLPHLLFDMLKDQSQSLAEAGRARVHVQVHNRSRTPAASPVHVWMLWTRAAAGLPDLNALEGGGTFDFWGRFSAAGIDDSAWPANAWWQPVGSPDTITGIHAGNPVVVTRDWTVPALTGPDDPGHFCIVALIHSADSAITRFTGSNPTVDAINRRNPQIGQKNLHVVHMAAGGAGGSGMGSAAGGSTGGRSHRTMTVLFHNPTPAAREASLLFDLRHLPPALHVELALPAGIRPRAVSGAKPVGHGHRTQDADRRHSSPERGDGEPESAGDHDDRHRYEASPGARVELEGVRIPAHGSVAARLTLRAAGALENGTEHRFDVIQQVGKEIAGGSTYIVRIGRPAQPRGKFPQEDRSSGPEWLRRRTPLIFAPPWAEDLVTKRIGEGG